jgi:hypothetical protein
VTPTKPDATAAAAQPAAAAAAAVPEKGSSINHRGHGHSHGG